MLAVRPRLHRSTWLAIGLLIAAGTLTWGTESAEESRDTRIVCRHATPSDPMRAARLHAVADAVFQRESDRAMCGRSPCPRVDHLRHDIQLLEGRLPEATGVDLAAGLRAQIAALRVELEARLRSERVPH